MSKTTHILAFRADNLPSGRAVGMVPFKPEFLSEAEAWVGPRPALENNPDFIHPIPYIAVVANGKILHYRRGAAGGEGRLHGKVSVGIGGHVDAADIQWTDGGNIKIKETLQRAVGREVEEELASEGGYSVTFTHVIQADATPVDQVHLGLVGLVDVSGFEDDLVFEDAMEGASFIPFEDLRARKVNGDAVELETWTALIADSDEFKAAVERTALVDA